MSRIYIEMSSFGTAKTQTTSLNLGMPTAFQNTYARYGPREMFAPERPVMGLDNTIGHDFQAQWHEQKMRDANHMANAKVQSTLLAGTRAFSSAHNHPGMPRAVLGQRRFANPSNGAWESSSTRLDQPGAPWTLYHGQTVAGGSHWCGDMEGSGHLVGGVLRTSAGQRHGKSVLDARIQQLNAINEAKQAFLSEGNDFRSQRSMTPFAGAQGTMDSALSSAPLVELSNLLQGIKDDITSNGTRKSTYRDVLSDQTKTFILITRMAINNGPDDIANVLEFIEGTSAGDGISQLLEEQMESFGVPDDSNEVSWQASVTKQIEWWGKIADYLKGMLRLGDVPLQTKQLASNSLIKSLSFNKLVRNSEASYRSNVVNDDDFIDTTGHINNPLNAQRAQDLQARAGRSGAFINPGRRNAQPDNPYASKFRPYASPAFDDAGFFTVTAPIREDSQMGYVGDGGYTFSRSAQEAYAFGSGEYQDNTGGRPRAWAGEEQLAEYGEQPEEEAVAEEEEQANLAQRDDGLGPAISSRQDATTGEWDIAPTSSEESSAPAPPPSRAPARAPKPYTLDDIPRGLNEIREFIKALHTKHGYSQAIYAKGDKGPKPANVRRNLIKKMTDAGLL